MKRLSRFSEFIVERQDVAIHQNVSKLYDQLWKLFKEQYEDRDLNDHRKIRTNENWFIAPIENFITPFFIMISPERGSTACFGRIQFAGGNQVPFISLGSYDPEMDVHFNDFARAFVQSKEIIVHELTHFYDFLKYGTRQSSDVQKMTTGDYFNKYVEQNAYYFQGVDNIIEEIKANKQILQNFNTFKRRFLKSSRAMVSNDKNQIELFYETLTEINKRKFLKRLYLLYQDLCMVNSVKTISI